MRFTDRSDAGRQLADLVVSQLGDELRQRYPTVVLGLARGGVPVAAPVAAALGAPLDVLVVRKLGLPWAPEVAFGAVAADNVYVLNPSVAGDLTETEVRAVVLREAAELVRRDVAYRGRRPPMSLRGRMVVLVDDGWATGATARAGVELVRHRGARLVIAAAPVAAPAAAESLRPVADAVLCLSRPPDFQAVSRYYDHFPQVTDDEVRDTVAAFT
jgi:predicted phosphoribosyltransferase